MNPTTKHTHPTFYPPIVHQLYRRESTKLLQFVPHKLSLYVSSHPPSTLLKKCINNIFFSCVVKSPLVYDELRPPKKTFFMPYGVVCNLPYIDGWTGHFCILRAVSQQFCHTFEKRYLCSQKWDVFVLYSFS